MKKLIIFDLDGTLIDAYQAIIASFNHTMKELGYPDRSPLVIRSAVGWGDENLLRPFVKKSELSGALLIYRRHHYHCLLKKSHLYIGVKFVLGYLQRHGYLISVASNRPTRFSLVLIRHLGLEKYFNYVLCADKLKHIKPHPEILYKIMRRFGLGPEDCMYVGDMTIDAQAGRRAGIETVIVTTGSSNKKEIMKERPYRIINRIRGMLKLL